MKRGPMGGLTVRDVANMDESPLALFGDQCKRSLNDIGTPNEIEGHVSSKVGHIVTLSPECRISRIFDLCILSLYFCPYFCP